MKTVKIKFISYADIFPEVFNNSILKKYGKNVFKANIMGKEFYIVENRDIILDECEKILSKKDTTTKKLDNFVNKFNFYYEYGCKDYETLNEIEQFYKTMKLINKITPINQVIELLSNENIIKYAYNVKTLYSFIKRNNISDKNLYYLPLFDLLLDEDIKDYANVISIYKNDYDWIVNTYLPVIEYLENNAPKINLQSYFYQIEVLQEEREQKNLSLLTNLYVGMDDKGYIYPTYDPGFKTGRIYTKQPNIQGLSKNIENEIFDFNNLQRFDFPNFEISIIAYLSGDLKLNNLLDHGFDIYYYLLSIHMKKHYGDIVKLKNTEEIKKLRKDIKDRFIKSLYSLSDANFYGFNQLIQWKKKILNEFQQTGKTFTYFWKYKKVEKPEQAINYPVQCFGANVAVYTCKKLIDSGYNVKIFKHDEFIIDDDKKLPKLSVKEIISEIEQTRPF